MKNRLAEYRKRAGLTQVDLAELAGTSALHVSRLERDERQFTPKWMDRFAPHLNCDPEDLISSGEIPSADGSVSIHEQIAADPHAEEYMSEREKRLNEKLRGLGEPEQKYVEKFIDSLSKDD